MGAPQALSVPYPQHTGVVPQQTHVVSNQQGDVYPNRQYKGQQVNQQLGPPGVQTFPQQVSNARFIEKGLIILLSKELETFLRAMFSLC